MILKEYWKIIWIMRGMMMMNNDNTVDIRPSLGDILNGYQRESYRPETAIAEFVDNSTASYYQNKKACTLSALQNEVA